MDKHGPKDCEQRLRTIKKFALANACNTFADLVLRISGNLIEFFAVFGWLMTTILLGLLFSCKEIWSVNVRND
jgi:hypothetical protein